MGITNQLQCGQPRTAATECNKQKVDKLLRPDQRIMVREISLQLGVGHHVVQEMVEILGYWKVCSCWFPHLLTEESKMAGNCSPIHPTVQI
jgi:hypothetical protein